jgi:O-antigen ligase
MSRVAFALLWCFVFVIPWEEIVRLPGLGSLPRLVGLLASAVGVLYVLGRGSFRRLSWFHVLAALFVLWAGIGAFWSIDPEATRVRVLTYVQLAVLAWLIWELAWSPQRQRALFEAYVVGATVGAAAIIRNYLSGVAIDQTAARFSGFNANPNELGLTLALALPVAWYLGASHLRRRLALAWWLYLPLGITAILLTGSRGAMVAALVGLLIVPWTLTQVRGGTRAALYMLGVGSIVLVGTIAPEATLERLSTTRSDIETGYFGGRGEIWRTGLNVAWEHPFGGVGAGAFGEAVAPALGGRRSAHQTFLAILVEEGFIGLTLFVAMVAALLNRLANLQMLDRRLAIMLLAVLAVGSLSSAWDYKKQLWLMLGLLAAQTGSRLASQTAARVRAGSPELRPPQGAIAHR